MFITFVMVKYVSSEYPLSANTFSLLSSQKNIADLVVYLMSLATRSGLFTKSMSPSHVDTLYLVNSL